MDPGTRSSELMELSPEGTGARRLLHMMSGLSVVGLLILLLSAHSGTTPSGEALGGTAFTVGGLAASFLYLWLRNSRLLVGQGVIGQRDFLRRETLLRSADVSRAVMATVVYSKSSAAQPALYLLSASGRVLMSVNVRAWGQGAIQQLVAATGQSLEVRDAAISAREFRSEFPSAVNWLSLHPNVVSVGIGLAAMAVAIGLPIAMLLSGH